MRIPKDVEMIIRQLEQVGHEAFAVGGCVRDLLLGKIPEDWDITTSAAPEQVKAIFPKTIDTGIQHGTVTVIYGDFGYEVTTYRIDGTYENHRHPKEVLFTENLIEDLKRRDFTINAMAYNPGAGVIDAFGGKEDLKNKVIRAVGNAKERFSEDALRMLRAIRFAGQLDFTIEEETRKGIAELAPTICHVSEERIRVELTKLLLSDGAECFQLIKELGLSKSFLPEWDDGGHCLAEVRAVNVICGQRNIHKKQRTALVFAALLHEDVAAKQAGDICRRLTFDNNTVRMVEKLLCYYDRKWNPDTVKQERITMRWAINEIGLELLPLLFILQEADLTARAECGEKILAEEYEMLESACRVFQDICEKNEPVTMKDLDFTGNDLLDMGMDGGPAIGEILQYLMGQVLNDPENNQKELLKQLAVKEWKGDRGCH